MLTRNPNVLKCPSFTTKPKSPDELAEIDLNAAARGLSDDEFEKDPAVIRAAADAQAWATRLERLASYPGKRNVILNLVDAIAAELDAAREAYRLACLDCFLTDDHDFNAAIAAQERVVLLEGRLLAAKTAKLDVDRSFSELTELRSLADKAVANLQSIRFELKRKAVLAKG
jgi:hypothetical protein